MVHGESDGFPGLVCDKYGDTLVLKLYSAAWIAWADEAAEALTELLPEIRRVVIRLSREVAATPEGASWCPDGSVFTCDGAPFDGSLTFLENGIRFAADVIRGQKTGFFLDQRDNRDRVRRLASGKRVLNVFSYSGGFSLYAAAGGATEVVSVDINRHAAGAVAENFALNPSLAHCPHGEIAADAFVAMGDLAANRRRFDLVIVDPPSFAKAEAEVRTALNTYSAGEGGGETAGSAWSSGFCLVFEPGDGGRFVFSREGGRVFGGASAE